MRRPRRSDSHFVDGVDKEQREEVVSDSDEEDEEKGNEEDDDEDFLVRLSHNEMKQKGFLLTFGLQGQLSCSVVNDLSLTHARAHARAQ